MTLSGRNNKPIFIRPDNEVVEFKMSNRVPFLDDECYPIAVPEKLVFALRRSIDNIHEYVSQNSFSTPAEKAVDEARQKLKNNFAIHLSPNTRGKRGAPMKILKRKNQRTMKKLKPKKMVSTKLTSILLQMMNKIGFTVIKRKRN